MKSCQEVRNQKTRDGVSVIVPAYNVAHCLKLCLDSVFAQSCPPNEIIVIDDGSEDDTAGVARNYGDAVRYERQANRGPSAARNRGIALATQPYVAFLDADDFWRPEFLAKCTTFLDQNPHAIAVSTGLAVRDASGLEHLLPKAMVSGELETTPFLIEDFFQMWATHDHVRTGSSVFRREILLKAEGFREDLRVAEDLEFWSYLATFGSWGFIPEPLWVGNPEEAACASGRLHKHRQRYRWCPTVECWQKRIVQRLQPADRVAFEVVRGRVAASYAQIKVLGGLLDEARCIVENYGAAMPKNWLTTLLHTGSSCGAVGWQLACWLVNLKETIKTLRIGWHI